MFSGLFILNTDAFELVYGPQERQAIERHVRMVAPPQTRLSIANDRGLLREIDVLFSGWGAPRIDDDFLNAARSLKTIFFAGGGINLMETEAMWSRGITVTSAIQANSIPVAEYTLATILFSLKHGWRLARQTREQRLFPDRNAAPGCYGSTIGLISLGNIARVLLELLEPFNLQVIAYDPYVSKAQAAELGVELVALDELFRRSDVVSLHTPYAPETMGIITGEHFASMKPRATFINTARGAIVRQEEMIQVAQQRPDLQFVLDVTDPEPPHQDCPLYDLPNVVLTPHIAGSAGGECRRMGRYMVEELERFLAGQPLKWAVNKQGTQHTSPRPIVQIAPGVKVKTPARPGLLTSS